MPNSSQQRLKLPQLIATKSALQSLVNNLKHVQLLAVDTESNSMYVYYEQVCLIQLSACLNPDDVTTPTDYIIDPLALDDLSPLGELFANSNTEIIFHAAEYDVMCLKRDFGFEFVNLFDTYIAARTLGWEQVGLAALLESFFDIQVNKRFQQADWTVRPLPRDQLMYAQMDTHFLPTLRQKLLAELQQNGLIEEAYEYFHELAATPAAQKETDMEGFWRIKTARDLEPQELAVLREIYLWREHVAQERNLPPYKILSNAELLLIAIEMPQNLTQLRRLNIVTRNSVDRYGQEILRVVEKGSRKPAPVRARLSRPPEPAIMLRFEALQEWRKQKAERRGVSSDIILSKAAMWALAHQSPATLEELATISEIGPYRRQKYAAELLDVLAKLAN